MSQDIVTLFGAADLTGPQEGVGFWHRVLARLIDLVFHYWSLIVAGLAAGLIGGIVAGARGVDPDVFVSQIEANEALANVAALVGWVLLHLFSEAWHGSTIGKRICGITVVSEAGEPAGLLAAAKRGVALYVDSLFFGLVAVGNMQRTPKNQRLGDRWARTVVVKLATLAPSEQRSWPRFAIGAGLGIFMDSAFLLTAYLLLMV